MARGRPKGSLNKRTNALLSKQRLKGILPLDFMLKIMRDEQSREERRDEMAKAAAPYLHAKLTTVAHTGEDGGPLKVEVVKFDG